MRSRRERLEETEDLAVAEVRAADKDLAEVAVVREVVAEAEKRLVAEEAGGSCDSR
jgi:hypothetical protein